MTGVIAVDSLKIRIPIDKVEVIDESLFGAKYIIDAASGTIEDTFNKKRHTIKSDGITTSYGVENQVDGNQKVREYLVILFNSKLLRGQYLEGVTLSNLESVYSAIISQKVVTFDYNDFLESSATDVDYKLDLIEQNFDDRLKALSLFAIPSKSIGRGINKFDKKTSQGIEFGKRETATSSYPYLKFYNKTLELLNNSSEFYGKFIKSQDISNLVRCEATIKNRKQFKRYGVEDTSLKSVVGLGQDKLNEILQSVINVHLKKRIVTKSSPSMMKPVDRLIYNSIIGFMSYDIPFNVVRESLIVGIDDKSTRLRKRQHLDKIYDVYIKDSEHGIKEVEAAKFYEAIGWF